MNAMPALTLGELHPELRVSRVISFSKFLITATEAQVPVFNHRCLIRIFLFS